MVMNLLSDEFALAITETPEPGDGMLSRMAEALLATTVSCLIEAGLDVPGRQYVYPGTVAADCEQVAVLFTGWTADAYGRNATEYSSMVSCSDYLWSARFSVVIVRCTPAMPKRNGDPPPVANMVASGRMASKDCEALTNVVTHLGEHGADVAITCGPPSGGMQTVELDLQLPYGGGVTL